MGPVDGATNGLATGHVPASAKTKRTSGEARATVTMIGRSHGVRMAAKNGVLVAAKAIVNEPAANVKIIVHASVVTRTSQHLARMHAKDDAEPIARSVTRMKMAMLKVAVARATGTTGAPPRTMTSLSTGSARTVRRSNLPGWRHTYRTMRALLLASMVYQRMAVSTTSRRGRRR